jgi:hypothetical protein
MDLHPAIATLQGDLALAALHNPHEPGSPESEKYHGLLNEAALPQNMHKYLGVPMDELVTRATKASTIKTQQVIDHPVAVP